MYLLFFYFLSHIYILLKIFGNIEIIFVIWINKNRNSLSLTKTPIYLLFLSKYLAYAFIWGSFIHYGAGKELPLCLYPIRYLNVSLLPYEFLSDNTILLISTSLIFLGLLFLWKAFLIISFSPKYKASCSILHTMKRYIFLISF